MVQRVYLQELLRCSCGERVCNKAVITNDGCTGYFNPNEPPLITFDRTIFKKNAKRQEAYSGERILVWCIHIPYTGIVFECTIQGEYTGFSV